MVIKEEVLAKRDLLNKFLRNELFKNATISHDFVKKQVTFRDSTMKSRGFASFFCKF